MFITLEGPEGSGKTTAVNYAVCELEKLGYTVVRTREPGGTEIAEQIRNVILDLGLQFSVKDIMVLIQPFLNDWENILTINT